MKMKNESMLIREIDMVPASSSGSGRKYVLMIRIAVVKYRLARRPVLERRMYSVGKISSDKTVVEGTPSMMIGRCMGFRYEDLMKVLERYDEIIADMRRNPEFTDNDNARDSDIDELIDTVKNKKRKYY